ncbi:MAG: transposase [Candidatus Competibacteraceae bacterium]|nr:transposase [Candidatus Competibacteraceae bacterium]
MAVVFHALTVTLYYVAGRGREWVDNVLDGLSGWLMSDGWIAYRHYPRRLRCWAHLLRQGPGVGSEL